MDLDLKVVVVAIVRPTLGLFATTPNALEAVFFTKEVCRPDASDGDMHKRVANIFLDLPLSGCPRFFSDANWVGISDESEFDLQHQIVKAGVSINAR